MSYTTGKIVYVLWLYWMIIVVGGWHALIDLEEYLKLTSNGTSASPSAPNPINSVQSSNATNASLASNTTNGNGNQSSSNASPHPNVSASGSPNMIEPTKELLELPGTGKRYFILRKRVSWAEAVGYCQSYSLRLASLPLLEDAKSLIEAIANLSQPFFDGYEDSRKKYEFGMDRRYWIGLTDMVVEGDWEWITEGYSLRYMEMWYPGQPDHSRQNPPAPQHCVGLWNPGYENGDKHTFNDDACTQKYYAICGKQPPFLQELLKQREINKYQPPEKLKTMTKTVEREIVPAPPPQQMMPPPPQMMPPPPQMIPPPPPPQMIPPPPQVDKSPIDSKDPCLKANATNHAVASNSHSNTSSPNINHNNVANVNNASSTNSMNTNGLKSVGVQTDPENPPAP